MSRLGELSFHDVPFARATTSGAAEADETVPMRARVPSLAPAREPSAGPVGQRELLRLAAKLPVTEGEEAVIRSVCEVVRSALPGVSIGVVIQHAGSKPRLVVATGAESRAPSLSSRATPSGGVIVDARLPSKEGLPAAKSTSADEPRSGTGSHPSTSPPSSVPSHPIWLLPAEARRVFASMSHEVVVPLPAPFEDSSLHLAEGSCALSGSELSATLRDLAERAALVLVSGLRESRQFEVARGEGAQLRALQARIIQSDKLASVGQVAAKVVHELNNPLTAIVTYAAFLTKKLERAGHDPSDVERLRRIGESADRILRFSRDLTTYARPQNETPGPVAIHEVVERAAVFCEHLLAEHGIRLVKRADPSSPSIMGMRGQLTQVFVNLITNACHAIQDAGRHHDGEIDIQVLRTVDGGVRVSIGDNGNGIEPENVIRIFDPFFTTKSEGRGTGLGLSIVRSIVEDHGGRVWVRSIVGVGSQFIVEFAARPRPTEQESRSLLGS